LASRKLVNSPDSHTFRARRSFDRDVDELRPLFGFISDFLEAHHAGKKCRFRAQLAVEEVFTNMVRHNTSGVDPISVDLTLDDAAFTIHVVDSNARPYDLTEHPEPDTTAPIEDREIGGLGIHLVRRLADDVRYEHANRSTTITLVLNLHT
jgi:anti-sigma regulatory factor (Ser/Thr protein kinase)